MELENIFRENNIGFSISGKDYLIKCLNPEHLDRNPSLRIDRLSGIGHCFSCGYSVNIFSYFNKEANLQLIKIAKLREKIARINSSSVGLTIPPRSIPLTREYRNISVSTLKTFGLFENQNDFPDRVVIPMRDATGKIIAFNARHKEIGGEPRYKIFPTGVELPFFPANFTVTNNSVVFVEGIFDALNLYDKGLTNVIALLGTSTLHSKKRGLNKSKVNMLKLKNVLKIYLLLDNDKAGKTASAELKYLLEEVNFLVEQIDLPEDYKDPGELNAEQIKELINYIKR